MINIDNGIGQIEGTQFELLYDFNIIINELLQFNSSMVIGVLGAWGDVLVKYEREDARDDVDISRSFKVTEKFIHDLKIQNLEGRSNDNKNN